jgi:hypothetical protein
MPHESVNVLHSLCESGNCHSHATVQCLRLVPEALCAPLLPCVAPTAVGPAGAAAAAKEEPARSGVLPAKRTLATPTSSKVLGEQHMCCAALSSANSQLQSCTPEQCGMAWWQLTHIPSSIIKFIHSSHSMNIIMHQPRGTQQEAPWPHDSIRRSIQVQYLPPTCGSSGCK